VVAALSSSSARGSSARILVPIGLVSARHFTSSAEKRVMPPLPKLKRRLPSANLKLSLGRRSGADVVGLDIQPGFVGAVQAQVNGSIVAEHVAGLPLASDTVREGEVVDEGALSGVLRELFGGERLSKRVRVGVANQRTVMRTLELPPMTDRKELAAAVSFQAQDQVPMPLGNAVLDFHPLGVVDTPAGPRQHVVLVAAQRDMIEHLLAAVRGAGLQPVGIDLSAFALIRSLYRSDSDQAGRVLYLNVDGLTNLAIAERTTCRFTRVVGGGLEAMAGELAERRGIALTDARKLLAAVDLTVPADAPDTISRDLLAAPDLVPERDFSPSRELASGEGESEEPGALTWTVDAEESSDHDSHEVDANGPESSSPSQAPAPQTPSASNEDARGVLESGIQAIGGEVRNSLDFHRHADGGGEVTRVVLSGSALDVAGFAEALQTILGIEVRAEAVAADESLAGTVPTNRLAVAAGLAATSVPE
jgi:type IV pilus assembly protein PilM